MESIDKIIGTIREQLFIGMFNKGNFTSIISCVSIPRVKLVLDFRSLEENAIHETKNCLRTFSSKYFDTVSKKYQSGYIFCEIHLEDKFSLRYFV